MPYGFAGKGLEVDLTQGIAKKAIVVHGTGDIHVANPIELKNTCDDIPVLPITCLER
jgi:hypothetical protein